MASPHDTNMDVIPNQGTMSSLMAAADTADFLEVQQDSEWQMARWKADTLGGMAIHHCRGCDPCTTYAAHLMAAFNDGSIRLPKKVVGKAIEKAWLSLFHDIEDMEEKRWQHCMRMLKDDNIELRDFLTSTRESLEKSRKAFMEECKHTEDLECMLDEECKRMRTFEHKLKRQKGSAMCLCSMSPCHPSHVTLGAGMSTWPDNTTLIE